MIACLFQKIKKILAWDAFEEKKKKRIGFESTVEGDDIRVGGERLVDCCLEKLCL